MKNTLTDKQKHQLNKWVESTAEHGLYEKYRNACDAASDNLDFIVTYSNMKSAEKATGISLIKAPAPKKTNDHEARIETLESEVHLLSSIIEMHFKKANPKPAMCHKHG